MTHTEKIQRWEKLAEIVGFIMSLISMMFTIRLMATFATDDVEYWLYIAFGATVQCAQIVLFVYAVYLNHSGHGGKAVTAFCLFCLLFVLSLAGTLGAFITSNKVQNNQELTQDLRLQDMQKRADSLDRQIERSQELIEGYQRRRLLTKGAIPEGKRLDRLNAERAKLSKEMADYKPEGTADSLYTGLAKLLGGDPEEIKMGLFALYAVALDLVSAVLLAFSLGFLGGQRANLANPDSKGGYDAGNIADANAKPSADPAPEPAFSMSEKRTETAKLQNAETDPANSVQYSTRETASENADRNPIGFISPSADGLTGLKGYIHAAYGPSEFPPVLKGRRRIADEIGITNRETDKFHTYLKARKLVQVRGTKCVPVMPKSELLARIA